MTNKKPIGHIAWNTNRSYTANGQRMAAISVAPDGVMVADYDRMLEFFLPQCELRPSAIMARYDANDRMLHRPPEMEVDNFLELRGWLQRQAMNAPKIKLS